MKALTDENFQELLKMPRALVYFYSKDCGACRGYGPRLEKVLDGRMTAPPAFKIDLDKAPLIEMAYQVQSLPTLLLLIAGVEKDRLIGSDSMAGIREWMIEQEI